MLGLQAVFAPKDSQGRHVQSPLVMLGGAGMGGKSYALRAFLIYGHYWMAAQGFYQPVSMLACMEYTSLQQRHFDAFQKEWGDLGEVCQRDKLHGACFKFYDERLGVILLRHLKNFDRKRGAEAFMVAWDESTESATPRVLGDLRYTCRAKAPVNPTILASNPDGAGFWWNRALFRPHLPKEERSKPFPKGVDLGFKVDPETVNYVPFLPDDNPAFDEKVFWASVSMLPPHVQQARRWGKWDMPEGARFGFNEEIHVDDFDALFPNGMPAHWPMALGVDPGMRDPCAVVKAYFDEFNTMWIRAEKYKAGLVPKDQAKMACELVGPGEKCVLLRADPAIGFKKPDFDKGEPSTQEDDWVEVLKYELNMPKVIEKPLRAPHRVAFFHELDRRLNNGRGPGGIVIDDSCQNLIRELTGALHPQSEFGANLDGEIDKKSPEHAITAVCYLAYENPLKAAPVVGSREANEAKRNQRAARARLEREKWIQANL
jgi:hypothetical protein